jgi:hypothetical protein
VEKSGSCAQAVSRGITIGKFSNLVIGELKSACGRIRSLSLILDNARKQ